MGIFNKLIPTYTYNKNGTLISRPIPEEVYIDDAFDPLFNRKAREYLNYKYGNPVLGTLGGFAEGVDNAIFGQKDKWGILGPGMGILSGFGRTMDKAGDFIIGGLTEGVNALNYINPLGANVKPENPLTNIFVEDEDYTGKRLLAAMGNSMSKLAGNTVLDESDFTGLWNLPATGLELATDPGLLGGGLAKKFAPELANTPSTQILKNIGKAPVRHTVGEIGQLLSNYDDLMTKVSWDATVPGLRPLVKNTLGKIRDMVLGSVSSKQFTDTVIGQQDEVAKQTSSSAPTDSSEPLMLNSPKYTVSPPLDRRAILEETKARVREADANLPLLEKMADDIFYKADIYAEDPEIFNDYITIKKSLNALKGYDESKPYIENMNDTLKKHLDNLEIQYNARLNDALTNTEVGKLLTVSGKQEIHLPKTLEDISYELDVQRMIDSFDYMDLKDFELGPGYAFNLDYYKNENGVDYERFLSDLENNFLKDSIGENVDPKIVGNIQNRMNRLFSKYGYETPDVKIFHSPEGRKNNAKFIAQYANARLKTYFKTHFGKEQVTADEFLKALKEDIIAQKYFESDTANKKALKQEIYNRLKQKDLDPAIKNLKEVYRKKYDNPDIKNPITSKYYGFEHKVKKYEKPIDKKKIVEEYKALEKKLIDDFEQRVSNIAIPAEQKLENIVNKFFNTAIIKNKDTTISDYIKNLETFLDAFYKNFSDSDKFLLGTDKAKKIYKEDAFLNLMSTSGNSTSILDSLPIYRDLFDIAEDFNTKALMPITNTEKALYKGVGESLKYNYLGDFNALLARNNFAFRDAKGEIDLNKIDELRKTLGSDFEVRIMPKVSKQMYPKGEFDTMFDALENHLKEVQKKVAESKGQRIPYDEYVKLNPYKQEFYENIKNDPLKQSAFTYVIGSWGETSPKNFTMSEAFKRLEHARKGNFSGKDLLRFTSTRNINTPKPVKFKGLDSEEFEELTKLKGNVNEAISNTYKHLNAKAFSKQVVEPTPVVEHIYNNVESKVLNITDEAKEVFGSTEEAIKSAGTPQQKRWFSLIDLAKAVKKKAMGGDYATLREKRVSALVDKFTEAKKKYSDIDIANYFRMRDMLNDDIVKGDNFISELISSNGRILIPINKKKNAAKIKSLTDAINHNILATSVDGQPIAQLVSKEIKGTDYVILGYKAVEDAGVTKRFAKLKNIKGLKDLEFHKAEGIDVSQYADLDDLFNEAQGITEEFSKTLGFTNFSSDYFKHVMSDDVKGGEWLNKNIYDDMDIDNLDELSSVLASMLNNNGTFRIQPATRSLRGNFADWNQFAPIFSTDLEAISKSTFSKGIFDNVNFQSYVDLFVNDNFKISSYARTPEDLKKILYAGYDKGNTGNLDNTLLVAPVYDANGKLTKFKRYDKYSDNGLAEALKNPDTILIPTSVLTPLDKIIRKDAKMSNKAFRFFNKYLNIPFKFGTLMNPGFLAGNLSDAYFKQAVTLSNKYGTSLSKELANVAASLKQVYLLNNEFDDVYRRKFLKTYTPEVLEKRKFLNISDIVINNKKINQEFRDWFKNAVVKNELSKKEESTIRLWMFLNDTQTSSTFKASSTDLGDLTEVVKKSNYEIPTSPVEHVLTGSGKYNSKDIKTWGIFANNPISNSVIDASSNIENYFRSASILNDLKHNYEMSDVVKILHDYDFKEIGFDENMETLNVKMMDAINTMHAANFDYENIPDFMDAISTAIPFPTFFMKNFGYWLDIMVNNPELLDNMITVQRGLWSDRDLSEDEFQAEAMGRGAIPTSTFGIPQAADALGGQKLSNLFKGIYKPTPMNSMFSAFNLLNNPVENVAFRINPIATPLTRHLQEEDSVKYRPYSTNVYERNVTPKDENFRELSLLFHRLNPFERQTNTYLRTLPKLEKRQAQLSDFAPSLFQPDFSAK